MVHVHVPNILCRDLCNNRMASSVPVGKRINGRCGYKVVINEEVVVELTKVAELQEQRVIVWWANAVVDIDAMKLSSLVIHNMIII